MLGNTLGTWGTYWELTENLMGTIKSSKPQCSITENKNLGPKILNQRRVFIIIIII
jgi:hypothetical protein